MCYEFQRNQHKTIISLNEIIRKESFKLQKDPEKQAIDAKTIYQLSY